MAQISHRTQEKEMIIITTTIIIITIKRKKKKKKAAEKIKVKWHHTRKIGTIKFLPFCIIICVCLSPAQYVWCVCVCVKDLKLCAKTEKSSRKTKDNYYLHVFLCLRIIIFSFLSRAHEYVIYMWCVCVCVWCFCVPHHWCAMVLYIDWAIELWHKTYEHTLDEMPTKEHLLPF